MEKLPVPEQDPLGLPDMFFVRPGLLLVFDRLADTLTLVAPVYADGTSDPEQALTAADDRLHAAAARLAQPLPPRVVALDLPEAAAPAPAVAPGRYRVAAIHGERYGEADIEIRAEAVDEVTLRPAR